MRNGWSKNAPVYLAGAAAVTSVVSIFAMEWLLGVALVWLIANRQIRKPPLLWPVVAWIGWTLISMLATGHLREGLPQVKKFYWFLMILVVYSAIRTVRHVRGVVLGWAIAASCSAIWGLQQFVRKYRAAQAHHDNFYLDYVAARITGFMSHWNTFSGHMMMALLLIGAMLLFSHRRGERLWLIGAGAIVGAALLLAETRGSWLGAGAGVVYLLWVRNRWLVAVVPVAAALVLLANPFGVRERAISIVHPHEGAIDSNAFHELARRVGWEMIKAHPLIGIGPEQVVHQFENYIPADVARPLPSAGYYGHLDNIYFEYGADRGLPALFALLWLVAQAVFDFARALRGLPSGAEERWILHGAVAVILGILLSGYFQLNLGDSEVLAMFLAVLACGYSAADAQARSRSASAGR